jgi:hypothetical protein
MHRHVLQDFSNQAYDHKNRDTLDNREKNLRPCNKSQNSMNRGPPKHNKSGYKNITWHNGYNKWRVFINFKGIFKNIGYFSSITEAIEKRNEALIKYHGEFACLENK